jgi:hypothetical protein
MWARVDDAWWSHPKVVPLSCAARGLWIMALSWAEHQGTAEVPIHVVEWLGATGADAVELVHAGLWEGTEDGWSIVPWETIEPSKRRKNIPNRVRRAVLVRDGHVCQWCNSAEDLTLDHIEPWSKGGADTEENLRVLCRPCNSRRGAP